MTGPAHDSVLNNLRAAFEPHGIFLRGVVTFGEDEPAPLLANGRPALSVVLLGNVGRSIWPDFTRWQGLPENRDRPDPLDNWSKAVIGPVAQAFGATAYFPSDPPWQPFQQWATQAEGLRASPLGILVHPHYGLWHGYRGALGFGDVLPANGSVAAPHPCDQCADRPCLSTCPASAVESDGFHVEACRQHLGTAQGRTGCMSSGCLARNACPVGADYRYGPEQLQFHMAALDL
ncbi:ferredoxin [Pararhizobium gei]|uniref:ferredoxin n=1 Tax=Pararhizobium gei TaxID=1395951 RepID=UPI0023DC1FD0|nr:ferredoxin [Rhizobium gei]